MWLLLSLLTAVGTSAQDIISKRIATRVSPYITAWAVFFFSVPFLALLLLVERPAAPAPGFWPVLLFDTILLTVSTVFFFKSIEAGDLSLTVPLLSFTPLFLLVTSPLIVHEFPRPAGIAGMVLIVAGSYVLHYHPQQEDILAPFRRLLAARGSRYMLVVALLYSIGGNLDKVGMRDSSPLTWSLALNACVACLLGAIVLLKVKAAGAQVRRSWPWLVAIGFFMALAMMFQMNALKDAIVPYVIAVKRTSIVLTALWGLMFLREHGARERLMAVGLMLAGVMVIGFAG